jgi:hypothetical protein
MNETENMEFTIRLSHKGKTNEEKNVKDISAFLKRNFKVDCTPLVARLLADIEIGQSKTTILPYPMAPCKALSGFDEYITWITIIRTG